MKTPTKPMPAVPTKKRCAIYTRKSTDEGLDQEYNSLEAQRDSALAFISSQRHEGWIHRRLVTYTPGSEWCLPPNQCGKPICATHAQVARGAEVLRVLFAVQFHPVF